jgi:hypothetical protein
MGQPFKGFWCPEKIVLFLFLRSRRGVQGLIF